MNPLAPVLQQEAQALLNTAAQLRPDQAEAALDLLRGPMREATDLALSELRARPRAPRA